MRFVALASVFLVSAAVADGLPLVNGRYPGEVLEFDLTGEQKAIIALYRTCQLEKSETMNVFTPYIFELTPQQAKLLTRKAGYAPSRFQVYETVRGFNDAGPHWNLALRYSETQIEIPLKLLLTDKRSKAAQDVQGWKSENPCFPGLRK